jgi:hypothetical protein
VPVHLGEIPNALQQKVFAARYGVDVRQQEPAGGWSAFKATALREIEALPLCLHGARVDSTAGDSLKSGLVAAAGRGGTLRLWIVDTVQHFSDFSDDGPDTAAAMAELRTLAREHHLAILVTAKVVTDRPDEALAAAHLPAGRGSSVSTGCPLTWLSGLLIVSE